MASSILILLQFVFALLTAAYVPTFIPSAPPHVNDGGIFGITQARQLFKRTEQCDQSYFFCPTGTCFTDPANGYIGCCTASSCAPRTLCLEYQSQYPKGGQPCDTTTGRCLYCSDSANPKCFKLTNAGADQWILYCATVRGTQTLSYDNTMTTGSQWYDPFTTTISRSTTTPAQPSTTQAAASQTEPSSISQSSSWSSNAPTLSTRSTDSSSTSVAIASPASFYDMPQTSTAQQEGNSNASPGLIGGAVGGGVAGIALMATALCMWRRSKPLQRRQAASGPDSVPAEKVAALAADDSPKEKDGTQYYSPSDFVPYHEADSRPVPDAVELPGDTGLGIAQQPTRYYEHKRESEAPVVSPLLDSIGSPTLPGATPRMSNRFSAVSPVAKQQPFDVSYTPSVYTDEQPGSIERPLPPPPPSLPQLYSSSTLHGDHSTRETTGEGSPSKEGQKLTAPWAYLSPEQALGGGWRNDRSELHADADSSEAPVKI